MGKCNFRLAINLVLKRNNKVLLMRRFNTGWNDGKYALMGGHVEDGESCEDTVIRELKEEMNLDIEIISYLGELEAYNQVEYYYHAKIVGGELKFGGEELERNSEDNYYEIRWISLDEIDNSGIRSIDLIKKVV